MGQNVANDSCVYVDDAFLADSDTIYPIDQSVCYARFMNDVDMLDAIILMVSL